MIDKPVILLGAGGHARVLVDLLRKTGTVMAAVSVGNSGEADGNRFQGLEMMLDSDLPGRFGPDEVYLVNGLGSTGKNDRRQELFAHFKDLGFEFATLLHPSAIVAADVVPGEGSQIMAGVVVQAGCRIGKNSILNTACSVDHDCRLGDHVHIAPGATLCGEVVIGDGTLIGAGATVIQGIKVGTGCLVAAGAVVVRDLPDGVIARGVPARVER
ncbi:MAG: acetyltransferase [Candidatus Glassbacteria bacterium]